ncbi:hypothetical protein [Streptomyces sp. URMC 124]|uniref:hypothetical protein n=1 Tax=Streptomyces sp. URMC 124 TaxID=3423405 RepID=UPI003F1C1404
MNRHADVDTLAKDAWRDLRSGEATTACEAIPRPHAAAVRQEVAATTAVDARTRIGMIARTVPSACKKA